MRLTGQIVLGLCLWATGAQGQLVPGPMNLLNSTGTADGDAVDFDAQLAADTRGRWVAVWQSTWDLGPGAGADVDVFCARSSNGGRNWSAPSAANTNAFSDGSWADSDARILTDRQGVWVVVWRSLNVPGSAAHFADDIIFSRSLDHGATWSAPGVLNMATAISATANDFYPVVAHDRAGAWLAVWSTAYPLDGVIDADLDVACARSLDGAATWQDARPVGTASGLDGGVPDHWPSVAGANGVWVVLWHSSASVDGDGITDQDVLWSRSSNNGLTWTTTRALSGAGGSDGAADDVEPTIATDGRGAWVAVWKSTNDLGATAGNDTDILVSRSLNNGISWSVPILLNATGTVDGAAGDGAPDIATDGLGNWIVVWASTFDVSGGGGTDSDILFARSTDNGATWSAPMAVNEFATSDGAAVDLFPRIATNRFGVWIASWTSNYDLGGGHGGRLRHILFAAGAAARYHPAGLQRFACDAGGGGGGPAGIDRVCGFGGFDRGAGSLGERQCGGALRVEGSSGGVPVQLCDSGDGYAGCGLDRNTGGGCCGKCGHLERCGGIADCAAADAAAQGSFGTLTLHIGNAHLAAAAREGMQIK